MVYNPRHLLLKAQGAVTSEHRIAILIIIVAIIVIMTIIVIVVRAERSREEQMCESLCRSR